MKLCIESRWSAGAFLFGVLVFVSTFIPHFALAVDGIVPSPTWTSPKFSKAQQAQQARVQPQQPAPAPVQPPVTDTTSTPAYAPNPIQTSEQMQQSEALEPPPAMAPPSQVPAQAQVSEQPPQIEQEANTPPPAAEPSPTPKQVARKRKAKPVADDDQPLDLGQLGKPKKALGPPPSSPSSANVTLSPAPVAGTGPDRPLNLLPNFKFYFDFWILNQPGVEDFTFKNVHNYIFIDLLPDKKLSFSFSFNLGGQTNFFELDYQATPRWQIRGGKIVIPFDDTFPHTMYGGRPNISILLLDPSQPFLPDIWAELGLATKYRLVDVPNFRFDAQVYVTNGFQNGGKDPTGNGGQYPQFAGDTTLGMSDGDNNRDKAFGGRIESLWFRKFGLNASYYTCRWSAQAADSDRLNALGVDSQLRFSATGTEFRGGLIDMHVQVPGDSFTRTGWYFEAGQKFGEVREWKALLRTGYRQNDSRVVEVNDQKLIGGAILWKPGLVQWSLETSRDLLNVAGKQNYSLTALRAVVEL